MNQNGGPVALVLDGGWVFWEVSGVGEIQGDVKEFKCYRRDDYLVHPGTLVDKRQAVWTLVLPGACVLHSMNFEGSMTFKKIQTDSFGLKPPIVLPQPQPL